MSARRQTSRGACRGLQSRAAWLLRRAGRPWATSRSGPWSKELEREPSSARRRGYAVNGFRENRWKHHADGLTELVGREEELELILRRWAGRTFLRPYMPATAAKVDDCPHCRRSATPIVGAVAPSSQSRRAVVRREAHGLAFCVDDAAGSSQKCGIRRSTNVHQQIVAAAVIMVRSVFNFRIRDITCRTM